MVRAMPERIRQLEEDLRVLSDHKARKYNRGGLRLHAVRWQKLGRGSDVSLTLTCVKCGADLGPRMKPEETKHDQKD